MSATGATARRVLTQLRHDPRTLALLVVVPCVLVALLHWVFSGQPGTYDRLGGPLLAIFPFVSMFVVTSVATLRERTSGTLERILTLPVSKLSLLLGYAIAFGMVAVVQAVAATTLSVVVLGLDVSGAPGLLLLVAVLDALLGVTLGLLVSAFAATEFQAVQFLPATVLPQVLVCGLLAPRDTMAAPLRWVADVLPLTYAVEAMQEVTSSPGMTGLLARDVVVVAGCVGVGLVLASATLRRRTA